MQLNPLSRLYDAYLYDGPPRHELFTEPPGEPALVPEGSVSWEVFSNPVSLFVGGVLAVILELALPPVRHGVWDHSTFRTEPRRRLQRTGLAAMVTVYAARSTALGMIEGVNRMHEGVRGRTASGEAYAATDEALLSWVQATAVFGFARAHGTLLRPLREEEWDAVFEEGRPAAQAYGAIGTPRDRAGWRALLEETAPRLEDSETLQTFLRIMTEEPVLPLVARPLQGPLVRVAAGLVPEAAAERIGLGPRWCPSRTDRFLARRAARAAERLPLPTSPRALAARRLSSSTEARDGRKIASGQGETDR
jgi:uncharacterized protein (DUF2236 family)